ncbi:Leucine-rich repeat flightless-interacting protein 2 [Corvus brachyrhynchos]|uniref:Leucine-rich repeat flightless-interacting protein 2 n=2 Tax=Corvus TaxID=30420 RepID=A0A091EMG2_CORBR|nr:Leucine-rich repeat flightless-interacting protein 2 [Corvus brachyrhynchos]
MGTPGSGRKRTPVKDRFSAEDEALSNIAREAEARLAAKRAARAEARDIRMRELERQQKEFSQHSYDRKWAHVQKWMEDAERARYSHQSSRHSHLVCVQTKPNQRKKTFGFWFHFLMERMKLPTWEHLGNVKIKLLFARSTNATFVFSLLFFLTPQSEIYYDQRNYSSLGYSKPVPSYHIRSSSLHSDPAAPTRSYRVSPLNTGLIRSISLVCKHHLHGCLKLPSEYSYSSRASSVRSSPVCNNGDLSSLLPTPYLLKSSDFSDQSETAADYFSRSSRRGSIVSDADDSQVLTSVSLEEKSEKSHSEIFSRPSSRNSVSATPLSGNSSRRGSGDASSLVDPDASLSELRDIYDLKDQIHDVEGRYMQGLKELKDSLAEVEEKYKKAMVSNAQLDNEKNNLVYQVDTLKDVIEEKEEQIAEFYRETEEKSKELERQKHTCSVLQHKLDEFKEGLRQRDELIEENQRMQENIDSITKEVFDLQETINWKDKKIGALERQKDYFDCIKNERDELREELADLKETMKRGQKHGLVIIPDGTPNGDVNHESVVGTITVVSQEAAQVLESAGEGPLDIRLRKLAGEKEELLSQVRKLKMQLEEERQKYSKSDGMNPDIIGLENGSDLQLIEMQRDANRQISEYKFKLSKAEQDIATLEQNIGRLEGQVARYKNAAENAEKVEDELKAEKRKLQRELRTALDKIEEMEMTNSHLMKRLEKMKANRTALLSQQ